MKNLAILLVLAFLALPGCSTSEPQITGDHDLGAPEDLEMEATADTSDLDPYGQEETQSEEGEISEEAQQEIQDIIDADQAK